MPSKCPFGEGRFGLNVGCYRPLSLGGNSFLVGWGFVGLMPYPKNYLFISNYIALDLSLPAGPEIVFSYIYIPFLFPDLTYFCPVSSKLI